MKKMALLLTFSVAMMLLAGCTPPFKVGDKVVAVCNCDIWFAPPGVNPGYHTVKKITTMIENEEGVIAVGGDLEKAFYFTTEWWCRVEFDKEESEGLYISHFSGWTECCHLGECQ